MRSCIFAFVASAAGALAATMQINDSGFENHMAMTLLEGLFGSEGQQTPEIDNQQNIIDMVMSKLTKVRMDTPDVVSGTGTSVLGWPTCKDTLTCNFNILHNVSLSDRLIYLVTIQVKLLGGPNKSQTQFKAIEGLMQYFIDRNLPNPNIAPSYGLAGVLEGIQRGTAIALGKSNDTFGNPSSLLWANFLRKVRTGDFNRASHDGAWSQAFQVGLDYGVQVGDRLTGTTVGVNGKIDAPERAAVFNIITAWTILAQNEGAIGRLLSLYVAPSRPLPPMMLHPLPPCSFTRILDANQANASPKALPASSCRCTPTASQPKSSSTGSSTFLIPSLCTVWWMSPSATGPLQPSKSSRRPSSTTSTR